VEAQLTLAGIGKWQLRKGPDVPPGYDPASAAAKPKTKAAKKNEKRKEKKQQVPTPSFLPSNALFSLMHSFRVS